MKIEQVPIDDLVPYASNPRLHSAEQVQQIANSILEFGFNNPILVDENRIIIAGHGRLEAARLLNLDEVPVITLSHLTETQRRAYVIADNKLALNASWDDLLLSQEIELLQAEDFDVSLLGFSEKELLEATSDRTKTITDGISGSSGDVDLSPSAVKLVLGPYTMLVPNEQFVAWRNALREQVGFAESDAINEILRRLGLGTD